jgi:hypothetical protein
MMFRVASSALILSAASAQMVHFGNINLFAFIDYDTLYDTTRTFTSTSCAVKEFSVGNELCPYNGGYPTRKLLRFSTGIWNKGPDDMIIPKEATRNTALYEFGDCHKHYHFK